MTYHLTEIGEGIATERVPVPDNGKVILTFCGSFADNVCVGGRFYPIVDGVAEIPSAAIGTMTPVTAYALSARRRYVCDPLGRLGEGDTHIAPLAEEADGHMARLAEALGRMEERLAEAEETVRALARRIEHPTFTIGGTV